MRRPIFLAKLVSVLLPTAIGCGSANLTRTGAAQASRGPNCEFQLLTATPNNSFIELGTIDVSPGFNNLNWTDDLSSFKEKVRPQVCQAGGDAAIAAANGYGLYVKATVLKMSELPARSTSTPAAGQPNTTSGCQYDTQCKGDRICVDGECRSPTPAVTP